MKGSVLNHFINKGQRLLAEVDAKEVLQEAGIPVNKTVIANSREEAVELSIKIGFPVVLKVVSQDVLHKTDAGGVVLGLAGPEQVGEAYDRIINTVLDKHPEANIEGVSVQKMISGGTEIIIGMTKDPQFGPMLMFGLGGVLVEVLKDVSFRIVPLTETDARDMLCEIKGYPLLRGFRGAAPVNEDLLVEILLKLSKFISLHPEIGEMDINPLLANGDSIIAADARMVLGQDV